MPSLKQGSRYIIKIWPRSQKVNGSQEELIKRLRELRDKISDAWPVGVNVVDEIKEQRTKPYDTNP